MKITDEPVFTTFNEEESKTQVIKQNICIAVGIQNSRTKLRVSVLLNTIPEYHVREIASKCEIGEIIDESDLIIGAGFAAREGVLRRKPVIVIGDHGFGGLITPDTLRIQYNNDFRGKIHGLKDEYFSLETLEREIRKGFELTYHELQMMSNQTLTFLRYADFLI